MKKNRLTRVFAVVLTVAMCMGLAVPASAAGWNSRSSWSDFWDDVFDGWKNPWSGWDNPWWGNGNDDGKDDDANGGSSSDGDTKLTLIEDQSTVADGVQLRASTYGVSTKDGETTTATNDNVKYFGVTLIDYDTDGLNNATHQLEVDNALKSTEGISGLTQWNGLYFSSGNPNAENFTYPLGKYESAGTVYIYKIASNSTWTKTEYYYKIDDVYYPVYGRRTYNYYNNYTYYYGYSVSDSADDVTQVDNNSYSYYPINTLYTKTATTDSLSYAGHNFWKKSSTNSDNKYGQYTYSGLVNSKLDANQNIQFNVTEPGIFSTASADWKTVYNVGLPFKFDSTTQTYTFDASKFGAYGHKNETNGSIEAVQNNTNLYYDSSNKQKISGTFGDGSDTAWLPFDTSLVLTESTANYHFGMIASIPFTMTETGQMLTDTGANGEDIVFSFSGDDDVWVFIDDTLVLDIGGIHNRLDGEINFAKNTWALSESNTAAADDGTEYKIADVNNAPLSGTLFNDGTNTGVINQTRATFAAEDEHTLTIYYLERGKGTSNCKIEFNLPQYDFITVTKNVKDTYDNGTKLSDELIQNANNVNFGFVITKNGDPLPNWRYVVVNPLNNNVIRVSYTNSEGEFSLRNNEKARFRGNIGDDNFQIIEKTLDTNVWCEPQFAYKASCAGGDTVTSPASGFNSMTVHAVGSVEAKDTIDFTVTNQLKYIEDASATLNDDRIVIDYGLPVEVDVLRNDIIQNGTAKITGVTGAHSGTVSTDGKTVVYTLTKQLTKVEKLTYTVEVTPARQGAEKITKTAFLYIIPATTMYYEEDFGLVTFNPGKSGMEWTTEGTKENFKQETGYVAAGLSPYGSDPSYKEDSGDSYGTSKYISTANGAASFSYTFTGLETSFFARTTNNSGYMRVVIKDKVGNTIYNLMRDTSYKTEDNSTTLYNIPVFTWTAEKYETYTVEVTVAGGRNLPDGYGNEFWLDGIRVVNPLDSADRNVAVANQAYVDDGESGMTVVTLRQELLAQYVDDAENDSINWKDGLGFIFFTDTNGELTLASEYKSNGPKEELYLAPGQSVKFTIADWIPSENKLHLGIKAPMGNSSVQINNDTLVINNTVDTYYNIAGSAEFKEMTGSSTTKKYYATYVITNTGTNVISITNMKITGNPTFAIGETIEIPGYGD